MNHLAQATTIYSNNERAANLKVRTQKLQWLTKGQQHEQNKCILTLAQYCGFDIEKQYNIENSLKTYEQANQDQKNALLHQFFRLFIDALVFDNNVDLQEWVRNQFKKWLSLIGFNKDQFITQFTTIIKRIEECRILWIRHHQTNEILYQLLLEENSMTKKLDYLIQVLQTKQLNYIKTTPAEALHNAGQLSLDVIADITYLLIHGDTILQKIYLPEVTRNDIVELLKE